MKAKVKIKNKIIMISNLKKITINLLMFPIMKLLRPYQQTSKK